MPYSLQPDEAYGLDIESTDYLKDHLQGSDRWILNFGPQHPATHTTLRLVLELDGERVARCTPHIGYLHSGFEKLGEHHDYNQYVCTISRMNYVSPHFQKSKRILSPTAGPAGAEASGRAPVQFCPVGPMAAAGEALPAASGSAFSEAASRPASRPAQI